MTCHITPDELRDIQANTMSEAELQEEVRKIALAFNWLYYHPWRSDNSPSGYPDVCAVKLDRIIYAELKKEGKDPTPDQIEWLDTLANTGKVEVHVWRPSDLLDHTIHETFAAMSEGMEEA